MSLEDQVIEGTCHQMCPLQEIQLRERQRRLHFFEIQKAIEPSASTNAKAKLAPSVMVKEFSRSAAGRGVNPSTLRPAAVLKTTMNFLIDEIADREDQPWHVVYSFMCDRIRAIRQDVVIQRIGGRDAIELLEKATRFHILAGYKLCLASVNVFDSKLNSDHTQECLKRLLSFYDELGECFSENRAEFEAYYLLYNAGSYDALCRGISLPSKLQDDACVRLALEISKAASLQNFVRFFRLTKQLSYLASCSLYRHFNHIRSEALSIMNTAYSTRNSYFPLTLLSEILHLNDEEHGRICCSQFGLELSSNAVKFSKGNFSCTDKIFHTQSCHDIDAKFRGKIGTVLHLGEPKLDQVSFRKANKRVQPVRDSVKGQLAAPGWELKRQLQTQRTSLKQDEDRVEKDENQLAEQQRSQTQMRGVLQHNEFDFMRGRGRGRWGRGRGRGRGRGCIAHVPP